jgi:putative transposase
MDRDANAAINILYKALKTVGLTVSACGGLGNSQPMKQELLGVTLEAHVTA